MAYLGVRCVNFAFSELRRILAHNDHYQQEIIIISCLNLEPIKYEILPELIMSARVLRYFRSIITLDNNVFP